MGNLIRLLICRRLNSDLTLVTGASWYALARPCLIVLHRLRCSAETGATYAGAAVRAPSGYWVVSPCRAASQPRVQIEASSRSVDTTSGSAIFLARLHVRIGIFFSRSQVLLAYP